MTFKDLINKTIVDAKRKKLEHYDDTGFLELTFSDGTRATIVAGYGGYTSESEDEYPTRIDISDGYHLSLVDVIDQE